MPAVDTAHLAGLAGACKTLAACPAPSHGNTPVQSGHAPVKLSYTRPATGAVSVAGEPDSLLEVN